jgi:cell division protein FtsA
MQESSRYAVGIDIGTTMIRTVVGHIDPATGTPTIVGVGQAPNSGMRKGVITNLNGPGHAIDAALGEAERMSGYEVNEATMSINGSHILSTKADGMIAVGMADHEVNEDDLARVEEVATVGKIPANREVLEVVPHSFTLDGQGGIKEPLGMSGTRLEVDANVVSALTPYVQNVEKAAEMATVRVNNVVVAGLAAAKAVLSESQIESGVAVLDLGGSTTSVAVFEEGDLQYVGVIPIGGTHITNDLAIGLKTDPEIAEEVKLKHAVATGRDDHSGVSVSKDGETYSFMTSDIDEIVEARLEEIFEGVQKELQSAGRAGRLPSGVVLTGGTANLKGIANFAKQQLGLAARVGKSTGFGGVADNIADPELATAIGLMLIDAEASPKQNRSTKKGHSAKSITAQAGGKLSNFLKRFRA